MKTTQKINLDFAHRVMTPRIAAVQGDSYSRVVEVSLYENGAAWTVPEWASVMVRYRKPDGTGGVYDTLPDGTQAWSASGNKLTVTLAPQMLAVAGLVQAQLQISQGANVLATTGFDIMVERDPSLGVVELDSEDYINWSAWAQNELDRMLAQARDSGEFAGPQGRGVVSITGNADGSWTVAYTDGNKETVSNAAYQEIAQKVVNLDAGKAPAGYGLGCEGGELKDVTDFSELDAINRNGWYFIRFAEAFYIDGQYAQYMALDVSGETGQHTHQTIHILGTNYKLRRYCDNGAWSTIEWENPPMALEVEYRTTERFAGSAVYTKLIDCGIITDGKLITTGINNIIRYAGRLDMFPIPFKTINDTYQVQVEVNNGYVIFGLTGFAEDNEGFLQLWYTK